MPSRPRILVLLPNPEDATSFYRGAGVFNYLHNECYIEIVNAQNQLGWSQISQFDIIFMQRPFTGVHVDNAKLAQQLGKKLWIDYDDLLTEVPEDNCNHEMYSTKYAKKNLVWFMSEADVVTFSTETLKNFMMDSSFHVKPQVLKVIPNAFNDYLFTMNDFAAKNEIAWRGSETHMNDLMVNKDAIEQICETTFSHWIGYNPWFIKKTGGHKHYKMQNAMDYFETLHKNEAQTFFVSLVDNNFNNSKSNIAWIEATQAGACCIVPHFLELMMPGVTYHTSGNDFVVSMKTLMEDKSFRQKNWMTSRDYILKYLSLKVINKMRCKIISQLI